MPFVKFNKFDKSRTKGRMKCPSFELLGHCFIQIYASPLTLKDKIQLTIT